MNLDVYNLGGMITLDWRIIRYVEGDLLIVRVGDYLMTCHCKDIIL
jgi:hypothetical protein